MVPIDDVVVPVSLTSLESSALEAEGAFPRTSLGGGLVVRKGKLSAVVVPRTEKVYGLDSGGSAEVEAELNGGHFDIDFGFWEKFDEQEELVSVG
jgi:hypothetical protein